jgi:hypothetical protein
MIGNDSAVRITRDGNVDDLVEMQTGNSFHMSVTACPNNFGLWPNSRNHNKRSGHEQRSL